MATKPHLTATDQNVTAKTSPLGRRPEKKAGISASIKKTRRRQNHRPSFHQENSKDLCISKYSRSIFVNECFYLSSFLVCFPYFSDVFKLYISYCRHHVLSVSFFLQKRILLMTTIFRGYLKSFVRLFGNILARSILP